MRRESKQNKTNESKKPEFLQEKHTKVPVQSQADKRRKPEYCPPCLEYGQQAPQKSSKNSAGRNVKGRAQRIIWPGEIYCIYLK